MPIQMVRADPVGPDLPIREVRGAHVKAGEPLVVGIRGAHVRADDPLVRGISGAHMRPDDPLACEVCDTQVSQEGDNARGAESRGARIRAEDLSKPRRRQRYLVPVAGSVGALVAGLGVGGAYAYFASTGSGAGQKVVGSPVSVTVNAVSGPADLLPGETGALSFTLHNPNPFGAVFTQVATVGTPVSGNTVACPSSNLSVVRTVPYTYSPAISVGAGATSGVTSIAAFVRLAAGAPNTCQGVTFTVTFTMSGRSS